MLFIIISPPSFTFCPIRVITEGSLSALPPPREPSGMQWVSQREACGVASSGPAFGPRMNLSPFRAPPWLCRQGTRPEALVGPLPPDALSALQPGAPVCLPGAGASSGTETSLPGAPRLSWALVQSHRRCSTVSRGTVRNGPEEDASCAWKRGSDATSGLQGDSLLLPPPSWWDCDWGASPSSLLQRPQTEGMSSEHLTRGSQWACTCFWLC